MKINVEKIQRILLNQITKLRDKLFHEEATEKNFTVSTEAYKILNDRIQSLEEAVYGNTHAGNDTGRPDSSHPAHSDRGTSPAPEKHIGGLYLPGGTPNYIRIYDNDDRIDRYTVVFTHLRGRAGKGIHPYVSMSEHPMHPQGVCMHDASYSYIDRPRHGHIGKKISFADLPKDCQEVVQEDYAEFWQK